MNSSQEQHPSQQALPWPHIPFKRIGVIGLGRVGSVLALALASRGSALHAVSARRDEIAEAWCARLPARMAPLQPASLPASLPSVQSLSAAQLVTECDLVLLALPDDALQTCCDRLPWCAGQSVLHLAGAADLTCLQSAAARGARIGSFHPLLMFGAGEAAELAALAALPGAAVAIDAGADADLEQDLRALASCLRLLPITVPATARAAYHASAHYAAAFLCVLLQQAQDIWRDSGLPWQQAMRALLPLAHSTLQAVAGSDGVPAQAMAGSMARGDVATVQRHLQALPGQAQDGYRLLALRSVEMALQAGRITAQQAEALRGCLRNA